MKSYLKKAKVRIEALGEDLELIALSASQHIEISDAINVVAVDDPLRMRSTYLTCKYGVVAWHDETIEDIGLNVPVQAVNEIATKVYELSGVLLAKNSESVTGDDSSST